MHMKPAQLNVPLKQTIYFYVNANLLLCSLVPAIASKIVSFQEIQIKHGKSERRLFGHSTNANFTATINLVPKWSVLWGSTATIAERLP